MATKYLPASPVFQAFDANGDPLSGGFLTFYEAGTTTPATTYSNSAGTSNASPIVLDARGEASVYLTAGLKYDVRLTSSTEVLVWTATRLSAPVTPSTYFTTLMDETTQTALFNIIVAPGGTLTNEWNFEDAAFNFAASVGLTSSASVSIGAAASNSVTITPYPDFYPAWNPTAITYSLGDTKIASNNGGNYAPAKFSQPGTQEVEFLIGGGVGPYNYFGIVPTALAATNSGILGWTSMTTGYSFCTQDGSKNNAGVNTAGYGPIGSSYNYNGHTVSVVYDEAAGTLSFKLDGVSLGVAFTGITGTNVIVAGVISFSTVTTVP